ncbi:tRNA dihydrouridine(20/20a) synthase DusA [Corallococcus praedator]|uniref:tRNA-dihydrouridine(20/20a) synthase n=1 Tax=Corallococcus praedator TaxID=2316724 RepID=A0ABX9QNP1_9BACT|nr:MULTISPECIES: tRNA dihydrouridine(20/20a) synthase DusA [Corallococcus]RKH21493.1 tRNA dihydrouridine(20/20a) synthase DusA [Corallococcus sp. CA047B]RKH35735.1 tRNA dihydrouridine(20/20a) synthase DusA [Corallococcus sp. CA031C]RKI13993.1 tRNA dihydrouridine(20/20a) synthase DusA [Corallococcus praedator]
MTALAYPMPLCVAPMMDWTDRHCRYFFRQITRHTLLYTEMVTTGAVLHGKRDRLLGFTPAEHPVALQLGGSEPEDLAASARIGEEWGYDEINLNVGCPSDRVQSGRFGACLMAEPDLVARGVAAMREAVRIPVTVKSRIAIDDMEEWATLEDFVRRVSQAGCTRFIVHARKAWLKGLSPKENRDVPPLRYDLVYRLKQEFPHLDISLNGGVKTLDAAAEHLPRVDGVMMGRAPYESPYVLADADRRFFGGTQAPPTRHEVVDAMLPYIEAQRSQGAPLGAITRHMLGLFQGLPGARAWRRHLSENAHQDGAGPEVVLAAAAKVPREAALQAVA